jgi:hypothetical protein
MSDRRSTRKTQGAASDAAERMRRYRNRQRRGLRCYTLQLWNAEVRALVRGGFLRADEQTNRVAVVKALHRFLDVTLGGSK